MRLHATAAGAPSERHPSPLLFVHGAWHASWCWEENFIPRFASLGYYCSAFDLRGHGQSEGRERLNDFGVEDYVADLVQQAQGLQKAPVVVAHSMGGLVAQRYAQRNAVAGLVLLAPVPLAGTGYGYAKAHPIPFLKFLATRNGFAMVKGEKLAKSLFFSQELPDDLFRKYYGKLEGESYKALLDLGKGSEKRALLESPPLLIIEAGKDAVIPSKQLAETAKFYGTSTVKADSVAHDAMIDVGWRDVSQLIESWLEKNGL